MNKPEILRKAAGFIREGWVQGRVSTPYGAVCLYGALGKAVNGRVLEERAIAESYGSLFARCCSYWDEFKDRGGRDLEPSIMASVGLTAADMDVMRGQLVDWNDSPGQTAENVAAALELAAIMEEEKEKDADLRAGGRLDENREAPAVVGG